MSDNSHAPKVPKAIVEQLEVHVEGVGERGTGDTPGPSDRDAAEASAQKGSSHMGGDGAQGGAHTSRRDFQRATIGLFEGLGRTAWAYANAHPHATLYGIIGFVAAALILIVGFWPTVLLAVFAAIGVVIGKYRDGDRKTRQQMKQVLERFN